MDEWREFIAFNFEVWVLDNSQNVLCKGGFSEVSGLEANMTPKTVKEGGRNWGEVQLAGPVNFPPVIMKRGVTNLGDLWTWFDIVNRQGNYGLRYSADINVYHNDSSITEPLLRWHLTNVMPVKFKGPDLSATANQVAVEELHLVHEGLTLERARG